MPRHFIIGTAGHIDHGKSTLVQTLTGTNPDRLPEEKERGVTIELGFAHFAIPTPAGNDTFELGVVDVPGHADFINNMVAGVGAIDLAIFIVAADDSWMPQSEEHLQILSYLGIKNFVVALTKADLCEDIEFVQEMLADDLKGTALENAPIIPVSAPTGLGIDELKETIRDVLWKAEQPRDFGQPRLAVDRAFSPKGVGTVVTGTLTGGTIATGDKLTTYPSGLSTNVRSIQSHSSGLGEAKPGMRTALNLPDLPLSAKGKKGISRGHLLVGGTPAPASMEIDVIITRAARPIPGQKGTQRPIKNSSKVYVHHGSGRSQARLLHSEEGRHIQPGETAIAQLRFEHPVHTLIGEHLVLRELSGEATLGGAVVL
ncbi:MAG: selenocysteine-specific translation elongation factor, partial [Akkermansiaceae bacterium]